LFKKAIVAAALAAMAMLGLATISVGNGQDIWPLHKVDPAVRSYGNA
jgi:hypothetical protein